MRENSSKTFFETKLNWDNEFSVRFKLDNNKTLQFIPNNIFSVELPEINATDIAEKDVDKYLKLVLRSTANGVVEKEVFDILFRTSFDVEVSLSNPNKVEWQYNSCTIDKLSFSELFDRKSKANPLNFTLLIKVSQIVYVGNGESEPVIFGERIPDRTSIEAEPLVVNNKEK
jgi:hypothetical protein